MQILKHIYQVGGSLNGITWCGGYGNYADCNTYIAEGDHGVVLFDCGNGETFDEILENMRYWGFDAKDIKACFITHPHLDHAGACHRAKKLGIPLYAHDETARAIESGDERCAGYLYNKTFTPCSADERLSDGDRISICGMEIEAMHCPGHTAGCTAFLFSLDGKRIAVSGDIIGTLLDGYFGWDGSFDFDRKTYLESLIRFSRRNFDIMLPGHGMVYHHRPKTRIENALNEALIRWRV